MNSSYPMCGKCKLYSCPYFANKPMYKSDYSRKFNNYASDESTNIMSFISNLNERGFIVQTNYMKSKEI